MNGLGDALKAVSGFLRGSHTLALHVESNPTLDNIALLVIDVQKSFCQQGYGRFASAETENAALRIKQLTPAFRAAGVPVYAIYYPRNDGPQGRAGRADFYQFRPEPQDTVVAKHRTSAFAGSNINRILQKDGKTHLLICGVYTGECVGNTALDAQKRGYNVTLIDDLMAEPQGRDHKSAIELLKNAGIRSTNADIALQSVRKLSAHVPKR